MAKKQSTVFFCKECGFESTKWMGQCPGCHEWNSFVEETVSKTSGTKGAASRAAVPAKVTSINAVTVDLMQRMTTGYVELDRVLGGGIVAGSLVLVGGDPGIGKSTLLLQVMRHLASEGKEVLYVSGEESLTQIRIRADRIGVFSDTMSLLCETDLDIVEETIRRQKPQVVVIDSVQTMFAASLSSAPGSVSQIREATGVFMRLAKGMGIPVFLVGHVTKEGVVAGPRVLEHMVDTVLYFEGDRHASYRILRGVKNRFGSTDEIGVFEMQQEGLREVANPSEFMLTGRLDDASGSVIACSMEGTRPLLLEIQALVSRTNFGVPRRNATGTDYNRVNLLMAVLEKRVGLHLSDFDAYVNIAGGIRISEPAIDLGTLLAVASSALDVVVDAQTVCFGEVGLSGEVRGVSMAARRVQEARNLGFTRCILPQSNADGMQDTEGITLVSVRNVNEAISAIQGR